MFPSITRRSWGRFNQTICRVPHDLSLFKRLPSLFPKPAVPAKPPIASYRLGDLQISLSSAVPKGAKEYSAVKLQVLGLTTLIGIGACSAAYYMGSSLQEEGLLDINTLNLAKWIQETDPSEEDLANTCLLAIENDLPKSVEFLMKYAQFSPKQWEDFFKKAIEEDSVDCLDMLLHNPNFPSLSSHVEQWALSWMLQYDLSEHLSAFLSYKEKIQAPGIPPEAPLLQKHESPSFMDTFFATDKSFADMKQGLLEEASWLKAPGCIAVLHKMGYFTEMLSKETLVSAAKNNNVSFIRSALHSKNMPLLGEETFGQMLVASAGFDGKETVEFLLSHRSCALSSFSPAVIAAAKQGAFSSLSALLKIAHLFSSSELESTYKQTLLHVATWPLSGQKEPSIYTFLQSPALVRDQDTMRELLQTLAIKGQLDTLLEFLSSSYAGDIHFLDFAATCKKAIELGRLDSAYILLSSPVFSKNTLPMDQQAISLAFLDALVQEDRPNLLREFLLSSQASQISSQGFCSIFMKTIEANRMLTARALFDSEVFSQTVSFEEKEQLLHFLKESKGLEAFMNPLPLPEEDPLKDPAYVDAALANLAAFGKPETIEQWLTLKKEFSAEVLVRALDAAFEQNNGKNAIILLESSHWKKVSKEDLAKIGREDLITFNASPPTFWDRVQKVPHFAYDAAAFTFRLFGAHTQKPEFTPRRK